jgi:hypothetical protein
MINKGTGIPIAQSRIHPILPLSSFKICMEFSFLQRVTAGTTWAVGTALIMPSHVWSVVVCSDAHLPEVMLFSLRGGRAGDTRPLVAFV